MVKPTIDKVPSIRLASSEVEPISNDPSDIAVSGLSRHVSSEVLSEDGSFFDTIFAEATAMEASPIKLREGPHAGEIRTSLANILLQAKDIDQRLGVEHLMLNDSLPSDLSIEQRRAFGDLRHRLTIGLHRLGEQWAHNEPDSTFRLTPLAYASQSPKAVDGHGEGCMNACFRMVLGAINQEGPSDEGLVATSIQAVHGTHLVPDEAYWDTFFTPTFQKQYPEKSVTVVNFELGIDLNTIARIK